MLPYVDVATFEQAPTGIDFNTIVPNATAQTQTAEVTNILERASRWVDNVCRQRLAATTDQEQIRVRPNRYGQLELYPKNFPIISLLSAQWMDPGLFQAAVWTAITVADTQLLDRSILVMDQCYDYWRGWGRQKLLVQYQYENGYAHTTLTGPVVGTSTTVAAGVSEITVASTIGIGSTAQGSGAWNLSSELVILDGANRETIEVASVSGNTLTLAAATAYSHGVGALVTAVPQDVQQTAIDFAAYLVKTRGFGGMEMTDRGFGAERSAPGVAEGLGLQEAYARLIPYTRVGAA